MTRTALALIVMGLMAAPASAQGRGRNSGKIPPGHMPAAGQCRVWYEGVPPGRQPAPTNCDDAERIASRDRNARVIYGDDANGRARDGRWSDRQDGPWSEHDPRARRGESPDEARDTRDRGRAVPRNSRLPGQDRGDNRPVNRRPQDIAAALPFQNGYDDGRTKGREDALDRDKYDPDRHSWYKSANRGYDSRYGSRDDYRDEYRAGFMRGYDEAYRRDAAPQQQQSRRRPFQR